MFVQELLRILRERSEIITNWLVATMNCRIEHRILYVNPELLTISRMVIDVCIVGDTKRIWIAFESSLCVRSVRYTNAEIAHWFRHSTAIARCTKRQYKQDEYKRLFFHINKFRHAKVLLFFERNKKNDEKSILTALRRLKDSPITN